MNASGIYKIQSICKPERAYIGSAVNISKRWVVHLCDLRKSRHSSIKLQRHFNKYGVEDLNFSIIEQFEFISKEHLLSREQYYLDELTLYFNTCKVAGSTLGFKQSAETCIKQRKSHKGLNTWTKGKHWNLSEETKQNHRESNIGKHQPSKEIITKLRVSHLGQIPWNKGFGGYSTSMKGKKSGIVPYSAFKKGHEPWNKGKETGLIPWNKGLELKKLSEEHKQNIRIGMAKRKLKAS